MCMFLGANLLSSGSFTMKPPPPPTPHNGGEGGRLPDESQSLQAFWSTAESRKSGKFFLVQSGIQILLTRNPKSKFIRTRNQESSTWNVEPADKNPESKTFLDYLTWVDRGHLLQ